MEFVIGKEPKISTDREKLVLIDGNGLAYRAFYALPPLKTSGGSQVNAVYGFTTMLLKIIEREKPDYVAVAFDKSRPTRRLEQFDEYKAHRQRMPDELRQQFEVIEEVVKVFRIPVFHEEGYEADDCIATLATAGEEKGLFTRIYSGDLDMLQLVTDNTEVITTRRGISDLVVYDRDMVRKRYSIDPPQLVDYKALAGDSSDHIPGIPGIGEASASKLLNQFRDIETMYEEADSIPSRWRKQILENRDQAYLSKNLVSLERNMPIQYTWEELELKEPDRGELKRLFVQLEFKTLLKKMGFTEEELKEIHEIAVQIVGKDEDLDLLLSKLKYAGVFSLFWVNDENNDLAGLSLAEGNTNGYYFPFTLPDQLNITSTFGISPFSVDKVLHELKPFLEDPAVKKYIYNLKTGIHFLRRSEYFNGKKFVDVAVAAAILESENAPKTLETIFSRYTDFMPKTLEEIVPSQKGRKKIKITEVPLQDLSLFIAGRAVRLNGLGAVIEERLAKARNKDIFNDLEMPLVSLLAAMEERGIKVDIDALQEEANRITARLEEIATRIYKDAGQVFNVNSAKQLGKVLFEDLGLPGVKSGAGYSTSAEVLAKLTDAHPIIPKILEYRDTVRLQNICIDTLKEHIDFETRKLHPVFNQVGTPSGKLTMVVPNLATIPEAIKRIFIPSSEEKTLISFELLHLDTRLLAHFSGDEHLIRLACEYDDLYRAIGSVLFETPQEEVTDDMHRKTREIVAAVISGASSQGLGQRLGVNRSEAKTFLDRFSKEFPCVAELAATTGEKAREQGYMETLLGRNRNFSTADEKNKNVRANADKAAMEFLIHGSAADVIKKLMVHIFESILRGHRDIHLLLQYESEFVFETRKRRVDKYVTQMLEIFKTLFTLKLPLKIRVKEGINWLDLKTKQIHEHEKAERK